MAIKANFPLTERCENKKREAKSLLLVWEQRESNPRPSACKADALNQLSYAPETGLQIYEHFSVLQILFDSFHYFSNYFGGADRKKNSPNQSFND